MNHAEDQYLDLLNLIHKKGTKVFNKRTGKNVYAVINYDITIDASSDECPVLTTRKTPFKLAVAELLGYIQGRTDAGEFKDLGAPSWHYNANENQNWLHNPNRAGYDDMGLVYGAVARNWPIMRLKDIEDKTSLEYTGKTKDLIQTVFDKIMDRNDDRELIWTYYNPGMFELGCLRPCLHTFQFSILDDTLYLNAFQRSCDVPLGGSANMIQLYVLLRLMAQITGLKPGKVYWKIVNAHIYEDQMDLVEVQLKRPMHKAPTLEIDPSIRNLNDVFNLTDISKFTLHNYVSEPGIIYPFSV